MLALLVTLKSLLAKPCRVHSELAAESVKTELSDGGGGTTDTVLEGDKSGKTALCRRPETSNIHPSTIRITKGYCEHPSIVRKASGYS